MSLVRASLLVLLLAGCGAPPAPEGGLPGIAWGPMDVETTATEPFELRGSIRVDWQDGVFGIDTEMEADLPRFVQRDDDVFYTSDRRIGWEEVPAARLAGSRDLSNRVLLWDLPRLLEAPFAGTVVTDGPVQVVRGNTTVHWFAQEVEVFVEVHVEDGRAVRAVVASPAGRESPFTFTAASEGLPFLGQHDPSRPAGEVRALDPEARRGHDAILRLVRDHHANRGSTPETVDPQSLAVERSLRGTEWPDSPYDGQPMRDTAKGGHFIWSRCTPQDATYIGLGWDRTVTFLTFGQGCRT